MKKKLLIFLALILLTAISILLIYVYQLSKSEIIPPVQSPTTKIIDKQDEKETQNAIELEKIKKEMNGIKNESFAVKPLAENEEDCSTEETIQYEKQITTGMAKIAEGRISEISNSSLKVDFKQGTLSWVSTISLDESSSISKINTTTTKTTKLSLPDLKVGDRIVVQTKGENITDKNFIAESIVKIE